MIIIVLNNLLLFVPVYPRRCKGFLDCQVNQYRTFHSHSERTKIGKEQEDSQRFEWDFHQNNGIFRQSVPDFLGGILPSIHANLWPSLLFGFVFLPLYISFRGFTCFILAKAANIVLQINPVAPVNPKCLIQQQVYHRRYEPQ